MPRVLCVGNGNLQVNFDNDMNIRDMYFPFVGMENHVSGHFCRFGVWVDGRFSWIDGSWNKRFSYKEDSLVTDASLKNPDLQLELGIEDGVHHFHDVFLRKITVKNTAEKEREVRLFFSHDLHLYDTDKGITAYYDPKIDAIIHFKKDRYFLISGSSGKQGLFQFAVGVTEFGGLRGTWKDAEDGDLSKNPVAHGSVDSTVSLRTKIPSRSEKILCYWIAAGKKLEEVSKLHRIVTEKGPQKLIRGTEEYYKAWVNKGEINFGDLQSKIVRMFKRSLLILRTQIDNRGAIIASSDSDILRFNKDTYSYVWPRDGAFVAMGLDAAGYHHITQRFFKFCERTISKEGFLFQKYNADGSWGSTWHPWIGSNREFQLPIQEDETALVLFSLWNHYDQVRDIEFVSPLYEPLVCKAADFMVKYRDPKNKLPLSSYDLWEENRGISTFTTSAIYGGLRAASRLARIFGDRERAKEYKTAAMEVKDAILKHLYDKEAGRFLKMIKPSGKGKFSKDQTVDSSVYGIFEFRVLPADDPKVEKTMETVESVLWVKTEVGGIARYQNDYYHQVSQDIGKVPGNPWPICTLWLAEWYIAKAKSMEDLKRGEKLLQWVSNHALESGVLAEQIDPYNNQPLSVSPLTWSHSTFVLTVIEYLNKLNEIKVCEACGLPMHRKKTWKVVVICEEWERKFVKAIIAEPPKRNSVKLVEIPKPLPGKGQVLLRTLCIGIDGTDREINEGIYGTPPSGSHYVVLGHETVARVQEIGDQVESFSEGDVLVPTVRRPCKENCLNCRNGEPDMCLTGNYFEHGIYKLHGFASEYAVSDANFLIKIPTELEDVAVLLEPLSIVEKAVNQCFKIQERMVWEPKRAFVVGAGPLGLLATIILRLKGLEVYAAATREKESLKAKIVQSVRGTYINVRETPIETLEEKFDIVIEATGRAEAALEALNLLGPNSVMCFLGVYREKRACEEFGKVLTTMVLGNRLMFGSVSSNKSHFEMGIKDMFEIKCRYRNVLNKLLTKKLYLKDFKQALKSEREDIKTVIYF